jgi:ABC-type multidrug transport system ATPase subunit
MVKAGDDTILVPTTLKITPGSFVAIIGGSGAGKTTLLKVLAGFIKPTSGGVIINGEPLDAHQAEIAYLPQDEIVHPALTVQEALRYAAQLRLPDDTTGEEIGAVVARVLNELDLHHRANARIANLSGGQRKRVGLGTELVSNPRLLFLDEATTGLDPVLEQRMMELMRSLARNGRSVVTVTHATRNLDLCDAIVVMGAGGRLCFIGSAAEARDFFEVSEPDEIYNALERVSSIEWQRRWNQWSSSVPDATTPVQEPPALGGHSVRRNPLRQMRLLAARYLKISIRDHRNLILLLGQVPVLAVAIAVLYPRGLWSSPTGAHNVAGLIFLVVTLAIWVGAIDASREIIKERRVLEREAAVGVGRIPYVCSKLCVLWGMAAIQAVTLTLVIALIRPGGPHQGELLIVVLATTWTAVTMGLLISAYAKNENQAVSLIPLALIPQLLFAGQIVPYASMNSILKAISYVIFARWAFAGSGHIVDIPARLPSHELTASFGRDFFAPPLTVTLCVLIAFMLVFLALTVRRLPRSTGG